MTSDLEKSFKAKLRAIAKEKNRDPADGPTKRPPLHLTHSPPLHFL
jgi:hypothetical protein